MPKEDKKFVSSAKYRTTIYVPFQVVIDVDYCNKKNKAPERILKEVKRALAQESKGASLDGYSYSHKKVRLMDIKSDPLKWATK